MDGNTINETNSTKSRIITLIVYICIFVLIIVGVTILYNIFSNDKLDKKIDEIEKTVVNSPQEFVNYLNSIKDYKNQEIIYDKLKLSITTDNFSHSFKIYYNDYIISEIQHLTNIDNFYLLEDNGKNAFVIINEESPVGAHSSYFVFIFDTVGEILLSNTIIPIPFTEILVNNNTILYQSQTKMQEDDNLNIMAENDKSFCEYLKKNYLDDYIVTGSYKYQYKNGEIILIEKSEKTIKNYKEKYGCG